MGWSIEYPDTNKKTNYNSVSTLRDKLLSLINPLLVHVLLKQLVFNCGLRSVSMDSATARFHIPTRHQDWNETIYEITPTMKHFTLLFPRLSKAFNCCKIIGSHARWWNDLALSGDFIPFHRVGNNARGVSPRWNYFFLSPLRFMQKV